MFHILRHFILSTLFVLFASQASAMFIQADWFDASDPQVGTNRYAYSHNDPINLADPNGNIPYNPGGSTSTGLHDQGEDTETYTSYTDHSHQDYETYSYSTSTHHEDVSYTAYGGYNSSVTVSYSNGSPGINSITPGQNFGTTVNTRSGESVDHGHDFANNGRATSADGALYTAATLPIGIVRAPAAASAALYGSSGPRVFWSGTTAGASVMGPAATIAAQNGMKTLEMTRAGSALTTATNIFGFNKTRSLWGAASRGFAKSATNGSIAVQGTAVRARSIWNTVERPILTQRGVNFSTRTIK
jgi:hypothetical protein